jgi:hypothetical protein
MSNWRDKVKTARLPERVVPLVMRGDLAVEHERLVDEIEKAKARGASSLAGAGTAELKEQLRAIEAEMQDSIVAFRLRALPRSKRPDDGRPTWSELGEQHPPRVSDGVMDARDRIAGGINADTFPEPLVKASVVEPDDITEADWPGLLAGLTQGQFDSLVNVAWELNRGEVDVPFWSDDSRRTGTTGRG